jgi:prevent-host-death family protein
MAVTVTVDEAGRRFEHLLERLEVEGEVVIERAGKPVARLVPVAEAPAPLGERVPGSAVGLITVPPDFDDPLPEEILESFYK